MKIIVRDNLVITEALTNQDTGQFLAAVNDSNSQGRIKYLGPKVDESLQVGMRVYFSKVRENINMDGVAVSVMRDTNIVALVEE